VFDLDPRVDFDEVVVVVLVQDELDGTRIGVIGRPNQTHGRFAHRPPLLLGQVRRGTLFDQLLVAALRRAITFPQMHHVAMRVGQDLNFDVARTFDQFFEVYAGIAEGRFGLGLGLRQRRL